MPHKINIYNVIHHQPLSPLIANLIAEAYYLIARNQMGTANHGNGQQRHEQNCHHEDRS